MSVKYKSMAGIDLNSTINRIQEWGMKFRDNFALYVYDKYSINLIELWTLLIMKF